MFHGFWIIDINITSKMGKPRLPTHVCLNRQANGLSCGSVILLEQLRTIDKSRLRERVGALDTSEMNRLTGRLGSASVWWKDIGRIGQFMNIYSVGIGE